MTAVEWLVEQLRMQTPLYTKDEIINEAKEMEKQQIIDCGNSCAIKQHLHSDKIDKMSESELMQFAEQYVLTFGEEYYNETFKQL